MLHHTEILHSPPRVYLSVYVLLRLNERMKTKDTIPLITFRERMTKGVQNARKQKAIERKVRHFSE
jgi:hypothetical protein